MIRPTNYSTSNVKRENSNNKKIIKIIRDKLNGGWVGRIKEIVQKIRDDLKIEKSISSIWRLIKRLGYSYKRLRKKVEKSTNNSIGILLRKLKRNWGVYIIKDGQVSNSLSPKCFMINNERLWLFDFSDSEWNVDLDRTYPMVN